MLVQLNTGWPFFCCMLVGDFARTTYYLEELTVYWPDLLRIHLFIKAKHAQILPCKQLQMLLNQVSAPWRNHL